MALSKFEIVLVEKKRMSDKVWLFGFKVPDDFEFKAGQYLSLRVDSSGDRRSYSIASAPSKRPVELLVDLSPDGVGSRFLAGLSVGDRVESLSAMGQFGLAESGEDRELVFVATGTGIAPFRSMIYDLLDSESKGKISLYWGVRFESDVFLVDELDKLESKYSSFSYDVVLSKPSDLWKGCVGHVTDCLTKHVINFERSEFYLCGSKAMIESVLGILAEKEVDKKRIFFEKFW